MTPTEVNALPERVRPPEPTHELCRWGSPYLCKGSRGGVIKAMELARGRPWWWLRLMGWHVREIRTQGGEQ